MVDSGPFHPQSVIDLSARLKKGGVDIDRDSMEHAENSRGEHSSATGEHALAKNGQAPATSDHHSATSGQASATGEQGEDDKLLSLEFLLGCLDAPAEQVKMWAAYHLVDRWEPDCATFMEKLWEQPQEEIRDSAINLIGKYRLEDFGFPLLRLFKANDRNLSHLAGVAMGRLKYEPARKQLHRWFTDQVDNPEANPVELESAAESLLFYNNHAHWDEVHAQLANCQQNHTLYSALFALLATHADTPRQMEKLAQAYGHAREIFHDFHHTQALVEMVGNPQLSRYLQSRLSGGYPLNTIYQEALKVLGVDVDHEETRQLIEDLAHCRNNPAGLERYMALADALLDRLFPGGEGIQQTRAFMQGCRQWAPKWENGVLKVREVEYHMLVSLPLNAMLNKVEAECLAKPEKEALRITNIYQSPLLSARFMGKVINLIASKMTPRTVSGLGAALTGWVRDEEKDALWKLYTNQLESVDYPFEQVLTQPWVYPLPTLMERLVTLLEKRFETYLDGGRGQAVDYCLEVFRRAGSTRQAPLLLKHFEMLMSQHYHTFVELMTHLPDERFLEPLTNYYREGEADLRQLICFICDVHNKPYPQGIMSMVETERRGKSSTASVRLRCPACECAYQYTLKTLYVAEERIEQRQMPTARDLWTPHEVVCKDCGLAVPLEPDERYLNELFSELLAVRLMRPSTGTEGALDHIRLIQFPRLAGKTVNPDEFLQKVASLEPEEQQADEENPDRHGYSREKRPEEEAEIMMELGRFRLETGNTEAAKAAFNRVMAGPMKSLVAQYYLGVIAFQEKNLYEARVHFSRVLQASSRDDYATELDNPVDMAQHYLKLLDKREFKRSHFQLITS